MAGAEFSELSIYLAAILTVAAVTMLYTYFGGIKAVVWMDVVQMSVYIGGALLAATLISSRITGGFGEVFSLAESAGKMRFIYGGFNLNLKEFFSQPYTFFTALIGGAFFSVASHGTDQLIVQRLLSTRSLRSGQKALIGSGFAVVFQYSLFMFIGLLLFGYYQGVSADQLGLATADEVFVKFIMEGIPAGFSGLIIAAILAAAMSTLSSSINSLASAASMDFYKPRQKKSRSPRQDLRISRLITLAWGLIITGSAFFFAGLQLQAGNQRPAAVELGLGIASYTYGGLLGIFLLGLLSSRLNRKDALFGFFSGLAVLLFLVDGPVQNLLPGKGFSLAWPFYPAAGSSAVVLFGWLRHLWFNLIHPDATK